MQKWNPAKRNRSPTSLGNFVGCPAATNSLITLMRQALVPAKPGLCALRRTLP